MALSARASLDRAQQRLIEAHAAYQAGRGIEALRAAQEASFEARQAVLLDSQSNAYQRLLSSEIEHAQDLANRLESATQHAGEQRDELTRVQSELDSLQTRLEHLESSYRRELSDALAGREAAEERARSLESELSLTQGRIDDLNSQFDSARERQQQAEREALAIQQQMAATRQALDEAKRQAATQATQARAVRTEARELASAYSERIESLERDAAKNEALQRAREEAQQHRPAVQISDADLRSIRPLVQSWKQAWDKGDMEAHTAFYAPNARGERVTVVAGKESATALARVGLVSAIRGADRGAWQEVSQPTISAEGTGIAAKITYRRKGSGAGASSADFWIRSAVWERSGAQWRIVRERWQFYSDVPDFPRR